MTAPTPQQPTGGTGPCCHPKPWCAVHRIRHGPDCIDEDACGESSCSLYHDRAWCPVHEFWHLDLCRFGAKCHRQTCEKCHPGSYCGVHSLFHGACCVRRDACTSEGFALGYAASALRSEAGASAAELKAAGYSASSLLEAGYGAADLQGAGFSAADLKRAGLKLADVEDLFRLTELRAAGFMPDGTQQEACSICWVRPRDTAF